MLGENTLVQNRYLVRNLIGRGGMGAVYLVEDTRFNNRMVALKEMLFTNNSKLESAFVREANLLAQLQHPRLPKVSDFFNENGCQYLVMDFVPGEDLGRLLAKNGRAFPLNRVLNWADSLLDILEYLHSQNPPVIHRDIKPQNLKLNNADQVILLDFGLAKDTPTQFSNQASSNSLVGFTPNYAPLEQIRGDGTTTQTDLYSFAATIYHLLTNMAPVSSLIRVQAKIGDYPDPLVPAHHINPEVPIRLSEILSYGLTLNQENRQLTAVELRRSMRGVFNEPAGVSNLPPTTLPNFDPNPVGGRSPANIQNEKTLAFSQPTQTVPGKTLVTAENRPDPVYAPPAKSGNRSSVLLFGLLIGILGVSIVAIFFIGQWISGKFNQAEDTPGAKPAQVSNENTAPPEKSAAAVGNTNVAVGNTNVSPPPPENKKVIEPKVVTAPPKPEKKPVTPKPVPPKPTGKPPGRPPDIYQ